MTKAEIDVKNSESQEYPKRSDAPWKRPGGVIAYTGEASAEAARKLRWQLTPAEKKIVDFVMGHQADDFRNMTPEQSAKQAKRIRALLDDKPKKSD